MPPTPDAVPGPSNIPTVDEVETLVRSWLSAPPARIDRKAARFARLVSDPRGLDFIATLIDDVLLPESARAAALHLHQLSRRIPPMLPWPVRAGIVVVGGFSTVLPGVFIPLTRWVLRRAGRPVLIDVPASRLDSTLTRAGRAARLAVVPVGDPVLGERAAARRRATVLELLSRTDLTEVTVDLASLVSPLSPWGFDENVALAVERVTPLFVAAAHSPDQPRLMLDMRTYGDLQFTLAVFTRVLDNPALQFLDAGIALPAALPESAATLHALTEWARQRRSAGGAGITVRLDGGAALPTERVDAALHDWPVASWVGRPQIGTQLIRMMLRGITPETTEAVRIVVAGHTLFDTAFAWLLAERRGLAREIDVQLPAGIPSAQLAAVRATVGQITLAVPLTTESDGRGLAAAMGRLDVNAWADTDLSAVFGLHDSAAFTRELSRFAASYAATDTDMPRSHRRQDRLNPELPTRKEEFHSDPPSDPTLAPNREWARAILTRAQDSSLGVDGLAAGHISDLEALRARIARASTAGAELGRISSIQRAELLHRVGDVLSVMRGRLIEVLVAETGMLFAEADAEASRAIDLAHYSATLVSEFDGITGAEFAPDRLTVVAPPEPNALSDAAEGVLSALAVGSAVLLVPAHGTERTASVLQEALREAGVPADAVDVIPSADQLLAELRDMPEISRVIVTPRPGVTSVIVMPSADVDQTVTSVVEGAVSRAGDALAATSVVILVGAMAGSARFRHQLADAVSSLTVAPAHDPAAQFGVLPEAVGAQDAALTRLADGESWLVKPRQLDSTDRLWSPGVRDGVDAASPVIRSRHPGVALALVSVATLDEAIALQRELGDGRAAGLHSSDAHDIEQWLDLATAGTLAVNRPTTASVVRRQPTGIEPEPMAGGPNALLAHGTWHPVDGAPSGDLSLAGLDARVAALIEACQPGLDYATFDRVRRAALNDAEAWRRAFTARDVSALGLERNVFRYRPAVVTVRLAAGAELGDLVRLLAAGVLARATLQISSAVPLPSGILALTPQTHVLHESLLRVESVVIESDNAWVERMLQERPARIRLIAPEGTRNVSHLTGTIASAVWAGPVTAAGRVELLPFVHEQTISMTAHRRGRPDRMMRNIVV